MGKICDMLGVREYAEGFPISLFQDEEANRLVVRAINEGGHNVTHVDVLDFIVWLKRHRPDLLHE